MKLGRMLVERMEMEKRLLRETFVLLPLVGRGVASALGIWCLCWCEISMFHPQSKR